MKTLLVLATFNFLLAVVPVNTTAQKTPKVSGFLESQTNFENGRGETSTGINGLMNITLTKRTGLYVFGQASRKYSQIYGGPTYSPKPWVQVGAGLGVEQTKRPFRAAGFVWVGQGKVSNLLIGEIGAAKGSGWYKDEFNIQATDRLGIGLISQRFLGTGPRFQLKLSKKLLLWGAPTYDHLDHKFKATAALRYNF